MLAATALPFVGGCSGDTTPTEEQQSKNEQEHPGADAVLDACNLPTPCAWPVDSGSPDGFDGMRCVVAELAAGNPVSVETRIVGDGPADTCQNTRDLHFGTDGTGYVLHRFECEAGEREPWSTLDRCDMLTRADYESCLAQIDAYEVGDPAGIACSTVSSWVENCVEVEHVSCP